MVMCVLQTMTKSKTFPLKQNLTCANYGVYVATCNLFFSLRYFGHFCETFGHWHISIICLTDVLKLALLTFYQRSVLSHSDEHQCGFVALLDECRQTVFQFQWKNYSEKTYFLVLEWLQLVFGFIDFDFLLGFVRILCWLLLFQPFNFSPVSIACSFQDWVCVLLPFDEIDFLLKKFQIDSLLSLLWGLVTWLQIRASKNHRKVKSRASDVACPKFLEVPNVFTLSE